MKSEFVKELTELLNRYSKENNSDTPDFILANYLSTALDNFDAAVKERELWYGREKHVEDLDIDIGVSDPVIDDFENQDIVKKKWLKIDEFLNYMEGTEYKIESNQSLSYENWKRIFNTFNVEEYYEIIIAVNKLDSVEVRKLRGPSSSYKRFPEKVVVINGFGIWYEFRFETKWTKAEARKNGCVGAEGISKTIIIDPSVWFTVNRLILSEKYNTKINLK